MDSLFTPQARKIWTLIPKYNQEKLLHAAWCSTCAKQTTIVEFTGQIQEGDLVLTGKCEQCGSKVARIIENK